MGVSGMAAIFFSIWKVDFKQVRKHDLRANGGQSGRRQRPDPAFREDEFNEKCNEKNVTSTNPSGRRSKL